MLNARSTTSLLVVVFAISSATAGFADDTLRECSVYPLAVGTEWVYAIGPVEMVERVTAHELVGEELCAKLETFYNGQAGPFEHITVREDGVYRVAVAGQTVEPAFCLLKWPAEEGDQWEVESSIQGESLSGSFTATLAEVTVPAGEYQTVHVVSEGFSVPQQDGTTIPLQFSYDFAMGVGKVKQVVQIGETERAMELKEVTIPEAP
jgi:hypothetical protein